MLTAVLKNREIECRALSRLGLYPDVPAVLPDDFLADHQPNARARARILLPRV